ncbi:MAG: hypothetical protein E6Q88_02995 [Lysobacteraceae bacterium]|nr:MAG: hypothetical protein E6Q88_02995 [Xanthomonadaceae bacterium]
MKTEEFFTRPHLIEDAQVRIEDSVLKIFRDSRAVRLKGLPPQHVQPVHDWLQNCASTGGMRLDIASAPKGVGIPILRALDSAGLVVEGHGPQHGRSGIAVLSRIEQRVLEQVERMMQSGIADIIDGDHWNERQLIGNAFEYYFITLGAYDAISPALARVSGELQAIMAAFVIEEYRHDRILLRALEVYGYGEHDVADVVPLPYTSAVINELFYLAHVDPLALLACLFVVEGRQQAGEGYLQMLQRNGAPTAYIESHREHDRINNNREHGTISRQCFKHVEYLSEEDEARITQRVLMLHRVASARVGQLYTYYADENNPCPRRVSDLQARPHAGVH